MKRSSWVPSLTFVFKLSYRNHYKWEFFTFCIMLLLTKTRDISVCMTVSVVALIRSQIADDVYGLSKECKIYEQNISRYNWTVSMGIIATYILGQLQRKINKNQHTMMTRDQNFKLIWAIPMLNITSRRKNVVLFNHTTILYSIRECLFIKNGTQFVKICLETIWALSRFGPQQQLRTFSKHMDR